ncbi:MAG: hypothetical protein A2X81_11285 [Desulfobacterales bacterium GWB2_56_26]|nr:MAG: hypothetical protein A2X81_11285 [Desulfobacterales bacterium GWB2_56_26]HBG19554.1 hypothetical protein [Desulfobulbaceae bacterium]
MPVFSYLAIPKSGAKETLCTELANLEHCRIMPADNHEVVVVVTDTPDIATEKVLQETLTGLQSLQSLSLTFGFDDN